MLVLGLESTCDETACAVVRDGKEILSSVVASQFDLHEAYGGVVPELACRRHVDLMIPIVDEALQKAGLTLSQIDLIAVAYGPGLIGALLIGVNTAKALALAERKPFIGVNHIEAHLYAALMSQPLQPQFPALGVVLSGGHTSLVLIEAVGSYRLIGQTVDDAIGEAFDKTAKMLGLPYPGGPIIEEMAQRGNPQRFPFHGGQVKDRPLDFSFSGLKTAVLYALKPLQEKGPVTTQDACDLAASFQRAACEDVVKKTLRAAEKFHVDSLIFGGGVTNNQYLRQLFAQQSPDMHLLWPSKGLSLDNAAMIAGLGYHRYLFQGHGDDFSLEPVTRLPI